MNMQEEHPVIFALCNISMQLQSVVNGNNLLVLEGCRGCRVFTQYYSFKILA